LFCAAVVLYSFPLLGQENIQCWGRIFGPDLKPIPGVEVVLSSERQSSGLRSASDASGFFYFLEVPRGRYRIRIDQDRSSFPEKYLGLEAADTFYLEIKILSSSGDKDYSVEVSRDESKFSSETFIPEHQIHDLPSGNSVWSLIENQDFSATTNRIDVGGIWRSIPALFSARGGGSWTQISYLLNGLNITDPYTGGVPLFYPDLWSVGSTRLSNAAHPAEYPSSGGYLDMTTKEGGNDFEGGFTAFYSHKALSSSNISPALQREGLFESHRLNSSFDGNFHFSGPVIRNRLFFFTSLTEMHLSRNIADYEGDDKAAISSGLARPIRLSILSTARVLI